MRFNKLILVAACAAGLSGCGVASPGTLLPSLDASSGVALLKPREQAREVKAMMAIADEHQKRAGIATGSLPAAAASLKAEGNQTALQPAVDRTAH